MYDERIINKLIDFHTRRRENALRSFRALGKLRHGVADKKLFESLLDDDKRRYKFHKEGLEVLRKVKGEQDVQKAKG